MPAEIGRLRHVQTIKETKDPEVLIYQLKRALDIKEAHQEAQTIYC